MFSYERVRAMLFRHRLIYRREVYVAQQLGILFSNQFESRIVLDLQLCHRIRS